MGLADSVPCKKDCAPARHIPDKLQAFMQGKKQSTPMAKDFKEFKHYLMEKAE